MIGLHARVVQDQVGRRVVAHHKSGLLDVSAAPPPSSGRPTRSEAGQSHHTLPGTVDPHRSSPPPQCQQSFVTHRLNHPIVTALERHHKSRWENAGRRQNLSESFK